jgi:hypothetical protein
MGQPTNVNTSCIRLFHALLMGPPPKKGSGSHLRKYLGRPDPTLAIHKERKLAIPMPGLFHLGSKCLWFKFSETSTNLSSVSV